MENAKLSSAPMKTVLIVVGSRMGRVL